MLELTARYADAWNLAWFGMPDERLARARGELAAACERVGRDPATLAITVGVTVRYPLGDAPDPSKRPALGGTPDEIAAGLRAHEAAGADHLIVVLEPCTLDTVAAFAEAVSRFRDG
jgi:alkanesulfonate monooxygenase SsuD/methylene tetrahydromethanopterin reductase-like flavin-dependent oxidoreductase (luciferase family)